MKIYAKYLILFLVQLWLSLSVCAQETTESVEDDGTNADGRVIIPATVVERCGLKGTSDPKIHNECVDKLTSDAKLGKTPEGEDYESEARKILKEQITGYMEIAVKRLIEASEHEEKVDKITEKSGDSRDDVEQIIKLSSDISSTTIDTLDTISLINTLLATEYFYFGVIPNKASSMTMEEASKPALRATKSSIPEGGQ